MKTSDVLPHFNDSARDLAEALGISVQAVYGWKGDVPDLRRYQIRELLAARKQPPMTQPAPQVAEQVSP